MEMTLEKAARSFRKIAGERKHALSRGRWERMRKGLSYLHNCLVYKEAQEKHRQACKILLHGVLKTVHLMIVQSYDSLRKSNFQPVLKTLSLPPSLSHTHNHYGHLITWSQFGCLATSLHLQLMQHSAIIWSLFATFFANFQQKQQKCPLRKLVLLNDCYKNCHKFGSNSTYNHNDLWCKFWPQMWSQVEDLYCSLSEINQLFNIQN